eukprot:3024694-Rhodomonas_salina.2
MMRMCKHTRGAIENWIILRVQPVGSQFYLQCGWDRSRNLRLYMISVNCDSSKLGFEGSDGGVRGVQLFARPLEDFTCSSSPETGIIYNIPQITIMALLILLHLSYIVPTPSSLHSSLSSSDISISLEPDATLKVQQRKGSARLSQIMASSPNSSLVFTLLELMVVEDAILCPQYLEIKSPHSAAQISFLILISRRRHWIILVASSALLVLHTGLCGVVSPLGFGYEVLSRIHMVRSSPS